MPDANREGSVGCFLCGRPFPADLSAGFVDRHVCAGCGKPQPFGRGETYFTALGVPEKFTQDRDDLQKRFYQASRALHPDRFGASDAESRRNSLQRMSFLNEAYAALRDPAALRRYVLELHGLKSEAAGQGGGRIPAELAEAWFELQDDLSAENVARFRESLQQEERSLDGKAGSIEARLDQLDPTSADYRGGLEELVQVSQRKNYLKSLLRDVERLAGK